MWVRYSAVAIFFLACGVPAAILGQVMGSTKPVVYSSRLTETGVATLRVRMSELVHRRKPFRAMLKVVYQYDPKSDTWTRLDDLLLHSIVSFPAQNPAHSQMDPVLYTFPPIGLFWAIWEEDGQRQSAAAYAGPILCQDVMLGPAPRGRVGKCVPFSDRAAARFVPDPAGLSD
jgi:hypothetical protein